MRFNEMGIDQKIEDLKTRVTQFNTLQLPGQPQGMHMGTSYLVSDLWHLVQDLRNEVEELHRK